MRSGGGSVEWRIQEQGPRVTVEAWKNGKEEGLYKAWMVGEQGRCLLGTLMPEGTRLFLRRTLSMDSLRRQGVWPIRRLEEELVCSFREPAPPVEWEDEVLRRCVRNLPRHTVRREGENVMLIFPFDVHAPFPLTAVFCFSRVEGGHLIFSFGQGGWPNNFPDAGKNKGEV